MANCKACRRCYLFEVGKVMTVRRIFEIPRLIGNSLDEKTNDALVGTEFYEADTRRTYVVYEKVAGISQWTIKK